MCKSLKLPLVFWLSTIPGVLVLLIIDRVDDLRVVFFGALVIVLLLILAIPGMSEINTIYTKMTILTFLFVLFCLVELWFLIVLSLFGDFDFLLGLVRLTLTLIL